MTRLTHLVGVLLVFFVAPRAASATEVGGARRFGLGFQLGDPTAIVGKAFVGSGNAIDFGLGFWGYGGWCYDDFGKHRHRCGRTYRALSIHGDFLWQDNIARGTVNLDWHIGAGGRLYFDNNGFGNDDFALAARMPVGLDLMFQKPEFLEVFFEIAPELFIVPFQDLALDAAIGVRFYF